ncbi:hypothetical protein Syun_015817 [Stephania yunnanensis]|uniref:Cell cycle checkpoint protein RAD17 n=1 Tax=Stephania yunnanensis TaxID=152371 RepID=A0AAP0JP99_9MAGN
MGAEVSSCLQRYSKQEPLLLVRTRTRTRTRAELSCAVRLSWTFSYFLLLLLLLLKTMEFLLPPKPKPKPDIHALLVAGIPRNPDLTNTNTLRYMSTLMPFTMTSLMNLWDFKRDPGMKKAGSRRSNNGGLWVDKHKPKSLEELIVHKKKVEEIKLWLKERLKPSKEEEVRTLALVVRGPAGVGKSATIQIISSHLGARLCEWNTPTPTLWQEHIHNSTSGKEYTSKLDEFEIFVETIRKYPSLSFSCTGGPISPCVLLIDDVPLTNERTALGRLCNSLHVLARSTVMPTVIIITDYSKAESADDKSHYFDVLQSSLESAGACKVTFNPLTINSIKKTLTRICKEEQCHVTSEQIDKIAKASGGDVRHAITTLQFLSLRLGHTISSSLIDPTTSCSNEDSEVNLLDDGFCLPFGRDETISLFHALGKFLHNKRDASVTTFENNVFTLRERFTRLPLMMAAPEMVLDQAHGQARVVTDFLHENVLEFISNDAIDDAWSVASYLSDADNLLGIALPWSMTRKYEAESIVQSVAASVAVRGVLFGNSHPAVSRWHSIRKPQLWLIEHSALRNKVGTLLLVRRLTLENLMANVCVMATEYKPTYKWIERNVKECLDGEKTEENECRMEELDEMEWRSCGKSDEIEDW